MRKQDLKQSPSSPAASPVSPSPPPESGGALRMNATCGRRCAELLPNCGPHWVLGENVAGFINMGLDKRFLTWQKRDTLFSHSYFRLAASARGMSASELLSSRLMFPRPLPPTNPPARTRPTGCVPVGQWDLPKEEPGRSIWSLSLSAAVYYLTPGGIGGLPLHPETGGLPGQIPGDQPVGADHPPGETALGEGGAEPGLGGMAHGLPERMDGRILWREEPADIPA